MIKNKFKKGFTLIELLVVIAVIGILASVSIFGLNGARESARDSRRKSDLEAIKAGLELYHADCNSYPSSLPAAGNELKGSGGSCSASNVYISEIPEDPNGGSYYYNQSGNSYDLCARLEASNPGDCTSASCPGGTCNYQADSP